MRDWLAAMAAVLVLGGAGPALAEPTPRALELAQRYAKAINFDIQMAAILDNMVPAMVEQRMKQRGMRMTGELRVALGRVSAETGRAISPKMLEIMIPVIAETYSEAELQAAVAYYESPEGRSLLSKTAVFTAKVTPALTELGPAIEADMEARLCRELGGCEGE